MAQQETQTQEGTARHVSVNASVAEIAIGGEEWPDAVLQATRYTDSVELAIETDGTDSLLINVDHDDAEDVVNVLTGGE